MRPMGRIAVRVKDFSYQNGQYQYPGCQCPGGFPKSSLPLELLAASGISGIFLILVMLIFVWNFHLFVDDKLTSGESMDELKLY